MYSGFGQKAGIGYENLHEQVPAPGWGNGDDQEMIQAGATPSTTSASVLNAVQVTTITRPTPASALRSWALTAKAKFGNNAVSAIYTTSETKNNFAPPRRQPMAGACLLSTTSASAPRCTLPTQLKTEDVGSSDQDSFSSV